MLKLSEDHPRQPYQLPDIFRLLSASIFLAHERFNFLLGGVENQDSPDELIGFYGGVYVRQSILCDYIIFSEHLNNRVFIMSLSAKIVKFICMISYNFTTVDISVLIATPEHTELNVK